MSNATAISLSAEMKRKALHLLALVLPLGILLADRIVSVVILGLVSALALAGDWARVRLPAARRVLHTLFGPMMRPEEVPPLHGRVTINGATWMCVSALLCVLLFPLPVAAAALVQLQVGDAAAALFGRWMGRHHWPGSPKSVEGTLAFAVTALSSSWGGALVIPGAFVPLGALVAGSIVAAAAEAISMGVNDNVRVPLFSGAVMWLTLLLTG